MDVREPDAKYLVRPGYKQTEAGLIPEDWEVTSVGREFSIQLGKMLDAEKNAGVSKPFLGNRAVQWGRIDTTDLGLIKLAPSELQKFLLRAGDLLVCEGGEVGRAAVWRDQIPECYYQKALHRLRPIRGYNVELMLNMLQHLASSGVLLNFVTQTSIAHLPKDKFETIPLPLPASAHEQHAIAEALSDADALIKSLEQLLAKKRQIKQGAMQELLTGKKRLSGFTENWHVKTLRDVASVKTGPFGSALHESDYSDSGTPIITVEHLGERGVRHSNLPLVNDADRQRLSAYVLEAGDIVFSRVGSVDRNALIQPSEAGWLFSGRLLRVRLDRQMVFAPFLSFFFRTEEFVAQIKSVAVGQTMASLNTKILSSVEIRFPCVAEQESIARILSDMDADLAALEARLAKARCIKQGMMQALLTGRIRLV